MLSCLGRNTIFSSVTDYVVLKLIMAVSNKSGLRKYSGVVNVVNDISLPS